MLNILWWSHNVDLICYDKLNDKLDNELKIKAFMLYNLRRLTSAASTSLSDRYHRIG